MDFLKTRAPFWKQVEQGGDTTWVEAKRADDDRVARWGASKKNHEAAE
jgi:molybdopterin synthase catalytic subunit